MSSPHSIKSAARKLPIKRKSPDPSPSPSQSQNPNLNLTPKSEDDEDEYHHHDHDLKPPPFKFHRIWTEPDEIRFLQGLLDSSTSHNYIFPRDLHLFYDGFSTSMSQPYTKSQLSEKLRRLRRKYRLISSRISHGLDPSRLSNHDQSLFEISKKLWDPNSNSNSPFAKKGNNASSSVSVEVSFNPSFTPAKTASVPVSVLVDDEDESFEELSDGVNIVSGDCDNHIRSMVSKTVMDVFDKCVEEAKSSCSDTSNNNVLSWLGKEGELVKRIREQRIAELDVVAQRMRLVLENSVRYP